MRIQISNFRFMKYDYNLLNYSLKTVKSGQFFFKLMKDLKGRRNNHGNDFGYNFGDIKRMPIKAFSTIYYTILQNMKVISGGKSGKILGGQLSCSDRRSNM